MRIIFMGTPDFAVPVLDALVFHGHDVCAVVTQPDRPKGRGKKLAPPPVKSAALALNLPVYQPKSPKTREFVSTLEQIDCDVMVVVAYGHILSESILNIPRIMPINIHASLLPRYRGPAPIQWSIINGESQTGVTAMHMDTGMDTGDMLATQVVSISKKETASSLHDRLARAGAELIIHVLGQLEKGGLTPVAQDHEKATYAPMLKKSDGKMDWTRSAAYLDRFVRAMNPWPGAFSFLDDKRLRILAAEKMNDTCEEAPGTVVSAQANAFWVATGKGLLHLLEVQGASGKRLDAAQYLCGAKICTGTMFQ